MRSRQFEPRYVVMPTKKTTGKFRSDTTYPEITTLYLSNPPNRSLGIRSDPTYPHSEIFFQQARVNVRQH